MHFNLYKASLLRIFEGFPERFGYLESAELPTRIATHQHPMSFRSMVFLQGKDCFFLLFFLPPAPGSPLETYSFVLQRFRQPGLRFNSFRFNSGIHAKE